MNAYRSAVDLAPTILELAGVKLKDPMRGVSLVPEIHATTDLPARPVICDLPEDTYNDRRRALIDHDGEKLIAFGNDGRFELYDLASDPGEKNNLFRKDPARGKAALLRYKQISATIPQGTVRGGIPREPKATP